MHGPFVLARAETILLRDISGAENRSVVSSFSMDRYFGVFKIGSQKKRFSATKRIIIINNRRLQKQSSKRHSTDFSLYGTLPQQQLSSYK
jgi:hypothetical protein